MIKSIFILLLVFFIVFLLIKFFRNPNLKFKNFFILFVIILVIYFIYTGKFTYLVPFIRNILPNLLKILGI